MSSERPSSAIQQTLDVGETRPSTVVRDERRVTNADAVSMVMAAHEFAPEDVEGWFTHEHRDVVREWVVENVEATVMRLLPHCDPHSTRSPMLPPLDERLQMLLAEINPDGEQATLLTDGGQSMDDTEHWQVVEITGVGIGEMWFDVVADELSRDDAETRASERERHVAVPMPYDSDEPVGIGEVVDDYDREVVER